MSHAREHKRRRISIIDVLGELFVTIGVILLLFGFYEAYWTNIEAGREQKQVEKQLEHDWDASQGHDDADLTNRRHFHLPKVGEAFARMYIPSFGPDYQFAIVEGTNEDDLLKGPGRYVDSQMPGQPGNFAVAGHRVGKGAPFNDLGNLKACDTVVVETEKSWDIYKVLPMATGKSARLAEAKKCLSDKQANKVAAGAYGGVLGRSITNPGDIGVIDAIPEVRVKPVKTDEALMTMTTCHPQFSNKQRMIIHAMLVRTDAKKAGYLPKELEH